MVFYRKLLPDQTLTPIYDMSSLDPMESHLAVVKDENNVYVIFTDHITLLRFPVGMERC